MGSISPMLKRMEKKGLVLRGRDPNDERRVVISLSASGHALREQTKRMLGEFYCYLSVPVDELRPARPASPLHRDGGSVNYCRRGSVEVHRVGPAQLGVAEVPLVGRAQDRPLLAAARPRRRRRAARVHRLSRHAVNLRSWIRSSPPPDAHCPPATH
ncbi:MAG: MarR family winged helix-turn-helix transcriptional regulator [Betaproteobacteria bacterium]